MTPLEVDINTDELNDDKKMPLSAIYALNPNHGQWIRDNLQKNWTPTEKRSGNVESINVGHQPPA